MNQISLSTCHKGIQNLSDNHNHHVIYLYLIARKSNGKALAWMTSGSHRRFTLFKPYKNDLLIYGPRTLFLLSMKGIQTLTLLDSKKDNHCRCLLAVFWAKEFNVKIRKICRLASRTFMKATTSLWLDRNWVKRDLSPSIFFISRVRKATDMFDWYWLNVEAKTKMTLRLNAGYASLRKRTHAELLLCPETRVVYASPTTYRKINEEGIV